MSKKFSASRKRAFLTYLSQTGNQTLSAERARVSRRWAQLLRKQDPDFDAACRAAVAAAKAHFDKLSASGTNVPPAGWRHLDGAELVVRGCGGASGGRRVQIARASVREWTPRVERRFLAALSATCSVTAACAEVGMWPGSAYSHRRRWQAFARAWDSAIEEGQIRLEMALLERGGNVFSDEELPEPCPITEMTAEDALALLKFRRGLERSGKWSRWKHRPRSLDEVRDSILRKIEAIERHAEWEERTQQTGEEPSREFGEG